MGEQAATGSPEVATRVVTYRVKPGTESEFRSWLGETNAVCSRFPRFVGFQSIPPLAEDERGHWALIYRFATAADLDRWLESPQRMALLEAGRAFIDDEVDAYTIASRDGGDSGATLLAAHRVAPGRESEYATALAKLNEAAKGFPGFLEAREFRPSQPGGEWTTLLRFRDQASLDAWVASPERAAGRELLYEFVTEHRVQRIGSGFGSWFAVNAEDSLASPAWKQTMAVLLGLFPTVMSLNLTVGNLMSAEKAPFPVVVFVGNLLGTIILSSLLMPVITRSLDWWLKPSCPPDRTSIGVVVLLALYAIEIGFFMFVWT